MKRILASSLGMTLGLLASTGRADDIVWRAAGTPPAQQVPTTAAPVVALNQSPPAYGQYYTDANIALIVGSAKQPGPGANVGERNSNTNALAAGNSTIQFRAQSGDDYLRPVLPASPRPILSVPNFLSLKQTQNTGAQGNVPSMPPGGGIDNLSNPTPLPPGSNYVESNVPGAWSEQGTATGRAPKLELTAEYLAWWLKGANGPVLVTTSPPGMNGFLPDAQVLLTYSDLDRQFRSGARFGATWWLDDCASYGIDARYFFTGQHTGHFFADSNQYPNLFRPFFAANDAIGEFSEQVTSAGSTVGSITADLRSNFWGAEINYRDNLCCWCSCVSGFRLDLLAGFRYLNLDERLTITENYTRLTDFRVFDSGLNQVVVEPAGTQISIRDRFSTDNDFYGGQLGALLQYQYNRLTFDLRTSVALGTTHQRLTIDGRQVRTLPGQPPLVFNGGLLALNSNIGTFTRDAFSVVPEIGLNVGYQLTEHFRAFVGYDFLYWSNVIRPGDQIDRVIDVNRVPRFAPPGVPDATEVRPAVLFKQTDFWAQGIHAGLEFRW